MVGGIFTLFLLLVTCHVPLLNAQNGNWFKDVTSDVNLENTQGRRLYFADLNNDNYPDLVLHDRSGRSNLQLFMNMPDSSGSGRIFKDTTAWSNINYSPKANLKGRKSTNIVMGDVDNDGDTDLMSCIFYFRRENFTDKGDRCACMLNNGNGKFQYKENSGLAAPGLINSTGMALMDYNHDGNIDIYISSFSKDHSLNLFDHDYLLKGNGDGTFENVSEQAGLHSTKEYPMYGINIMDWNNDGYADVAPSPYCRHGGDFWKNTGNNSFKEISSKINYNAQKKAGDRGQALCQWAADPSDFDNDGDLDFYISLVHGGSGFGEGHSTLVMNHGADSNFQTSWAMDRVEKENPKPSHHGDFDADWLDINNDGLMDLVTGQGVYNPSEDRIYFHLQNKNHFFDDVTAELNMVSTYNQPNKVQALDYDLDGDDDLMISEYGNSSKITLLENTIGNQNNWVSVKLDPPENVNADAIGSRVYVYAGSMTHMRDVYAGEGNMGGQSPFILNFGVGKRSIDSIKVRWPNEFLTETMVYNPSMNQLIKIDGKAMTSTQSSNRRGNFEIYPNPVNDQLRITFQKPTALNRGTIKIYDMVGKKRIERDFSGNSNRLAVDVEKLNSGWYVLRLIEKNGGNTTTLNFIKQ